MTRPAALALLAGAVLGLGAFTPSSARAQGGSETEEPQPIADELGLYENRVISEVYIRPAQINGEDSPLSDSAEQQAVNNIRSQPGTVFDAELIRNDIRRLNRLGAFSRVEVYAGVNEDGSVTLVFEVLERRLVADVQVAGNEQINDAQIANVVDVVTGTPIDRFQIDRSARRIEELYRQKGYYYARVSIDEQELADTGLVLFRILEGDRLRVTAIRFTGNESFTAKQLRRELETKVATFFSKGQLDDDKLDADIANLITFYRDRGYLDIRADRLVQPAPNGRESIVTYIIEEGALYTLRSVQIEIESDEGQQPVFDQKQIAGLLSIKAGDVYSVRELNQSLTRSATPTGRWAMWTRQTPS